MLLMWLNYRRIPISDARLPCQIIGAPEYDLAIHVKGGSEQFTGTATIAFVYRGTSSSKHIYDAIIAVT